MKPRYEVLVIDLDGTLLGRDGLVSARNVQAVQAARAEGIAVIIATGRSLIESKQALTAVNHQGLVVAAGGSLLCDAGSSRTIARHVLPPDLVADATRWLLEHDHKALILKDAHAAGFDYLAIGASELDPASRWWFERMDVTVKFADDLADDTHPEDSVRAGAVGCESRLAPLAQRMRQEFGERCCMQHWSAVTETNATGSATHLLEIFQRNVNKWTMVEAHCAQRGIDSRLVAAIGDGLNDVELVQNAGLGVAMANAGPQVLAVAQRVTVDHDHDGVAVAIDHILAGTW